MLDTEVDNIQQWCKLHGKENINLWQELEIQPADDLNILKKALIKKLKACNFNSESNEYNYYRAIYVKLRQEILIEELPPLPPPLETSIDLELSAAEGEGKIFLSNWKRPKYFWFKCLAVFFLNIPSIFKLMKKEPEIIFLGICQLISISFAYWVWTYSFYLIPDNVADIIFQKRSFVELFMCLCLAWLTLLIWIVSYQIGLFNAATIAVHKLKAMGSKSTAIKALKMAKKNIKRIRKFEFIDAWITCTTAIDRIPKKGLKWIVDRKAREFEYYAWKLATFAVIPSLMDNEKFMTAGEISISLLKKHPLQVIGLRAGYSILSWLVAIATYAFLTTYLLKNFDSHVDHFMYHFFKLISFPLLAAICIVSVFIRPFFYLGVAKMYTDNLGETHFNTQKKSQIF